MIVLLSATAAEVFTYIGYVIIAILALMVMIVIHELGHYLAGKALGFKIDEFAIGFGPPIFKKKLKSGEQFSIRPFPIGGYCAFAGEDEDNPDPKAFNNQKPWKRLIVLFSGAFFNFISAIIFIAIFFSAVGQVLPQITDVKPYADGSQNAFMPGDVILSINGRQVNVLLAEDIENAFSKVGDNAIFKVLRDGKKVKVNVYKYEHGIFEAGDVIIGINGKQFKENEYILVDTDLSTLNSYEDGTTITFTIKRGESILNATGTKKGESKWTFFGFGVTRNITVQKLDFFTALGRSFGFSFFVVFKILASLGALITGKMSLSGAGGTITVVKTI
ncbi:MAG: PDZ domain-containing protein, partial [Clostridiales bacterium]|nr:PDZ domain-containing protein [Clostridiales bacterium]